jgi:hypothetical protein
MQTRRRIERERITLRTLTAVEGQIERLNRQIEKIGLDVEPVRFEKKHVYTERSRGEGVPLAVRLADVVIDAPDLESIVKPGFSLIALATAVLECDVQAAGTSRIITRVAREDIDLSSFRTKALSCDVCGAKRYRKTVLILREDASGRLFGVGTDCAEVYLPRVSTSINFLEDMLGFEPYIDDEIDAEGDDPYADMSTGRMTPTFDRDQLLTDAVIWVDEYGYVRADEPQSTKEGMLAMYLGRDKMSAAIREEFAKVKARANLKEIKGTVRGLLAWVEDSTSGSDYIENLRETLKHDFVTEKRIGLAISAASVYRGHLERERIRAIVSAAGESDYFGKVKQRFGVIRKSKRHKAADLANRPVGTVVGCKPNPGYYGTTYRVTIVLDTGPLLIWWASNDQSDLIGRRVGITATVKEHKTFQGRRQTVITRANLEQLETTSSIAA